ncbi:helix-turn-helix domain-containing protein [Guptibacillus hwajinpoensis]|uniref:Resolvase HTH domain-containing protein n=1 Tax=Guptibacillus hwajinpoensis TaxID=208199 RepID=A0A0J6CWA0_9BACL|nr:helix-turn-helix domain-containing protein [Alkalihalobacillus macyae]KMM36359.1 hypothetical protein AB986_18135 [Alkalihalobacillus macyae]
MSLQKKWTEQTFDLELEKHLPGWKRTGEVRNAAKTVEVLCPEGHLRKLAPGKIKTQDNKCIGCIRSANRKEACETFLEKLKKEQYKPKFMLENYENANFSLPVICPNGSQWKVSRTGFLGKQQLRCRCELCLKTINPKKNPVVRKPNEAAIELLELGFEINPNNWKGIKYAIEGKWIECGHTEIKSPDRIIFRHERCGRCKSHLLRLKIEEYQKELGFIIKDNQQLENIKKKQTIDVICVKGHEDKVWIQQLFKYKIQDFKDSNAFLCNICKAEYYRGENNPLYIHGKSIQNSEGRTEALYKRWFRKIKRAYPTCQVCRNNLGEIAHHLYGFNEYENLRYTEENGVSLCRNCHDLFHDKFHYGGNTLEQFIKFLEELDEYDTNDLHEMVLQRRPFLLNEIEKKKNKRIKVYSITKLALLVNTFPEIIRILVTNGEIKGAFKDQDNMWVITQENAKEFVKKTDIERQNMLSNCLVGKKFGNLTVTKLIGRKSEGKQARMFVEVQCKCGNIVEKPYYRLVREKGNCSWQCGITKEMVKGRTRLDEEFIDKVKAMYLNGYSSKDITEKYNISYTTVYQYLKLSGISTRQRKRVDQELKDTVANMYLSGSSVHKISEELNVHPRSCYEYLKEKGIKSGRKKPHPNQELVEQVAMLYEKGKKIKEISEELKVNISVCYDYLVLKGLWKRNKR